MRFTFYTRALLLVGTVVAALIAISTAYGISTDRHCKTSELHLRLQQLTHVLATAAVDPLWSLDREDATQLLRGLEGDPDFYGAKITTPDGALFTRAGKTVGETTGLLRASAPIVMRQAGTDRVLGTLTVSLDPARLHAAQALVLRNQLLNGGLQLLVVLSVLAVTLRAALSPLAPITARLLALDRGQVNEPVPGTARNDEIGAMARAVDRFRGTLIELERLRAQDHEAAADLAVARDEAEAASAAKSRFVSMLSHELRTPLGAILGFAQLLEIEAADKLTAEQRDQLQQIGTSGRHLLRLIDDILDAAKIEAGRLVVMPVAFAPDTIVRECVYSARLLDPEFGLTIELASTTVPPLIADPMRFRQVLLNLLSNAVKYNRPGGSVTVTMAPHDQGFVRTTITDNGYGIPADQREGLFEPFNRLGKESTGISGAGIGLSISRQLVTLMGGRIGCTSVQGEGSTFWFDLPAVMPAMNATSEQAPVPAGASSAAHTATTVPAPALGDDAPLPVPRPAPSFASLAAVPDAPLAPSPAPR